MYTTQFLPLLVRHLNRCRVLKSVPFRFDKNSGKLVLIESSGDIKIYRIQCILTLLYVAAMFAHLCFGPLTVQRKFQGFSFFGVYVMLLNNKWNFRLDIAPVQVLNSCVKFEGELVKGNGLARRNFNYIETSQIEVL